MKYNECSKFHNHVDEQYLTLLQDILDNGIYKEDRTGTGCYSVFGREMRFDIRDGKIPLLTTKKVFTKGIVHELIWFLKGDTNNHYLAKNNVNIWTSWANEYGDLGPIYSAMWRRWPISSLSPVLIDRRIGPAAGPVEYPTGKANPVQLESKYIGDLDCYQENGGCPYRIIEDLGTMGGRNTVYLVQFVSTGNMAEVTRPNVRNKVIVRDSESERVFGVGVFGKATRKFKKNVYDLWNNMLARCYNPNNPNYKHYGGVGVYVSPRWLHFENFLDDLSTIPNYEEWSVFPTKYHLDKDYFGSNCYDVSTTVFLPGDYNRELGSAKPCVCTHSDGRKYVFTSIGEAAKSLGVSKQTLQNYRQGTFVESSLKDWVIEDYLGDKLVRKALVVDQIKNLIDGLKNKPMSRRHLVSAWNPSILPDEMIDPKENVNRCRQSLPPCHTFFQLIVEPLTVGERLGLCDLETTMMSTQEIVETLNRLLVPKYSISCQLYQRSADAPLGLPFNIAQYSILTHMLAQVVNMVPKEFIWCGGDCHIYSNQIEKIKEQMKREPIWHSEPKVRLNGAIREIDDFKFEDIEIVDYVSHERISFPDAAV